MPRATAADRARCRAAVALGVLVLACVVVDAFPAGAAAEQASEPRSPAAAGLDAGGLHSCAVLVAGSVRCWGYGANGQLGYGNTDTIGDNETPASVGPVNFGAGRTVKAIAAGDYHTCALLDDGTVRCSGFGGDGRLGYGNTNDVSDPSSVGPVDLGSGRTAKAITAGAAHTCAILDNGNVLCWGYGGGGFPHDGRLGYGNTNNVGDVETPASVGPVKLGAGRTAVAISAGGAHTCALLDDNTVKCWGRNNFGQLGYGNTNYIGDSPTTTPDTVGPVNLGPGRSAMAITAGGLHTCALLDDGSVRCWGDAANGRLGYGNENTIGDTETPDTAGPVRLGPGRTATAISAGDAHTCALLDDGNVRCWGLGASGRLGYGNPHNVGAIETPDVVGPVDLGRGRTAVAISAGTHHTCARLDDASVRCWGDGANGRLGYCNQDDIGDDEASGSVGPVSLEPGDGGAGCAAAPGGSPSLGSAPPPASGAAHGSIGKTAGSVVGSEARRASGLRGCLAVVARQARGERTLARRRSARPRATVRLHIERHASSGRRRCLRRYARTPGRIALHARALSTTTIELSFNAPGTDGSNPPAARTYVITQAVRPMRRARDFARAQTLCKGHCHFAVTRVGAKITLTVTGLRPHTTYHYAVAARDNVSARIGPRSQTVKASTR